MAFVSELFDQFRDLIGDATDTEIAFATKKIWLNRGISRMFPRVGRIVSDASLAIVADQYEYDLPSDFDESLLLSIEIENDTDDEFDRLDRYDIIQGDEDLGSHLVLLAPLAETGKAIRVRYFAPIPLITSTTYAGAQAETWLGPDRCMGLPVLYAMGMAAARKVDDRQVTKRYSTTQGLNGVTDQDIMAASQMWFGQFEYELAAMERPLPPARD